MHARQRTSRTANAGARRGNTIVLVTGILVLLVIIATAFVVRTQAGRTTAVATVTSNLRDDNARMVADDIAGELGAASLFVRRFDFTSLGLPLDLRVGSNVPRLPISNGAIKFLGDEQNNNGDLRPDYPYNYPAYEVVPFTNWPDPGTTLDNWGAVATANWAGGNGAIADWPFGTGNPTAVIPAGSPLLGERNPLGNPGMADLRLLRDLEPQRWDADLDADQIREAFSHWRHMTNIARADNGWRAVHDISDVGDSDGNGYGQIVTDLNVPFEQFLAIPHAYLVNATGDTNLAPLNLTNPDATNDFLNNWGYWMGVSNDGLNGYIQRYRDPALTPPNFIRLRDLDADGVWLEDGERPQDEFAGPGINPAYPNGAPRWQVGRILADTDGDGYTDAFWFLAPSPVQSGVRTLVAVSIIDNQGMLNANVATRFIRADPTGVSQKTAGHAPTDIAAVGQGFPIASGNFNVGFYDNWDSWLIIPTEINTSYDTDLVTAGNLWFRHLTEVGLSTGPVANPTAIPFPNVDDRLNYWRRSASRPLSADPQWRYTPFTLSDELELRMFAGQNYPWIASRYEFSASENLNGNGIGPLRANLPREESSEFIDQLPNRILAADLRHRVTLFNGVRNDVAAPWLWLYGPNRDNNGDGSLNNLDFDLDADGITGDLDDIRLFQAGTSKFDLRLPYDQFGYGVQLPGQWDGLPGMEFDTNDRIPAVAPTPELWRLGIALRDLLRNALMDDLDNLPTNRGTYYGPAFPGDVNRTLELAAAYAANIAQWRDREAPAVAGDLTSHELSRLSEAVPAEAAAGSPPSDARFMGMEPQPFLVEAFIGHIYSSFLIPAADVNGAIYSNAGNNAVIEDDAHRSTVVVVQIANPYNRPINFDDPNTQFQVRVFGQDFDLANVPGIGTLQPASEDQPATLVLYAIKDNIDGTGAPDTLEAKWLDFLDISINDLCPNSPVVRVDTTRWDIDSRSPYDTSGDPAIEIRRLDPVTSQWVTIDRIDPPADERFGDAVEAMSLTAPPSILPPAQYALTDPAGGPYPGIDLGPATLLYDHWVQWVRATRAWGVDVNNDGEIDSNEINPRYVFGDYAVAEAAGDPVTDPAVAGPTFMNAGNRYQFTASPDGPAPALPWFTRPYTRENPNPPAGQNEIVLTRKPTFFDMDRINDPAQTLAPPQWSFPNKGWYGQKGPGSPDDPVTAPIVPAPPPPVTDERVYRTPYAFQMLHKDNDFEQVGELLNVFLYGHKLRFTDNSPTGTFTGETITTFSEYLSEANADLTGYNNAGARFRSNRLLLTETSTGGGLAGAVIGIGDPASVDDPRHAIPALPAGLRVFDAFVCDGFGIGRNLDFDNDSNVTQAELDAVEAMTLRNAKNFDGSATPGLINANTAPVEVLRCLPHMARLVHETGGITAGQPFYNATMEPLVTTAQNPAAHLPRVLVPESIEQYRERYNGGGTIGTPTGVFGGPNYEVRANPRGFGAIGELLLLNVDGQAPFLSRPASNGPDTVYPEQFRFDMGVSKQNLDVGGTLTAKPFYNNAALDNQVSMRVSVDRQDSWDPFAAVAGTPRPDFVAGDAEEANALFAGISNLVTTRSDTFTVYFKVRSFRQNTSVNPPRWDATNPEYIIDDSRYVMLVDRSGVNKPGDAPKILYLEKLPN